MKRDKIFGILYCVIGMLIALGPKTIFHVCDRLKDDGSHMACFYTSQMTMCIGMGIVMFSLMLMILKETNSKIVCVAGELFFAVAAWLTPNMLIGVCSGTTMQCRMVTLPAINIASIVSLIISIVYIILLLKEKRN